MVFVKFYKHKKDLNSLAIYILEIDNLFLKLTLGKKNKHFSSCIVEKEAYSLLEKRMLSYSIQDILFNEIIKNNFIIFLEEFSQKYKTECKECYRKNCKYINKSNIIDNKLKELKQILTEVLYEKI